MKFLSALLALSLALPLSPVFGAEPAPAAGEERIEKLEQRIDKIDRSLEQILKLLQNQSAAPAAQPVMVAPTATSATADSVPAAAAATGEEAAISLAPVSVVGALKPGVLLDVWLRPELFRGNVPSTPSLVTMRDTRGPLFQLGRHADERELKSSVGKPLVQVWRCYLNIKTAGAHVLLAEFRRTTDRQVAKSQTWDDFQYSWNAHLSVNGRVLLDESNKFESAGKGTLSRTFTLDLKPGYYEVHLVTWLPKHPMDEVYDYKPLTFALRLREPGALKPRDLGPADFFCRE